MIVDCHTHAGSYKQVMTEHEKHLDKLLESMQVAGVDASIVLPIPTGKDEPVSEEHNKKLITGVLKHNNLIPFCCLDSFSVPASIDQLKKAVDLGARGLKTHPILQHTDINDPDMYPVYDHAQRIGLPVLIHGGQFIGHKIAGTESRGLLRRADPLMVDEIAVAFPELKIIFAHFGWPWLAVSLAVMQRHENVFLDLSGWAPKHFPAELVPYVLKANTRKFLFGTDYPFITPQRWLTEFRVLCPNAEAFAKVAGTNLEQVLKV